MTARQKRLEAIARAKTRNAKDREAYKERQRARDYAEAEALRARNERESAEAARKVEAKRLRDERDALERERSRLHWEKWHKEQAEREAANRLAAQDLADARKSEAANGPERAYCRLDVSEGVRCWLLPGHQGRCQPAPPKPSKGGRGLGLLLMAAAMWGAG